MSDVSVKKVLRTIKASNKLEGTGHLPLISPKCGPNPRSTPRNGSFMLTDVTHRKTITFGDNEQYFRSTKKPKISINCPKIDMSNTSSSRNSDLSHFEPTQSKTSIEEEKPQKSKFMSRTKNLMIAEFAQDIEEEKPKKSKFMSRKKNLLITEFVQYEDEKTENKENTSTHLGLEEEIKENLVQKQFLQIAKPSVEPMTTASLIRRKNMTPKFKPNFMSQKIFNIPDLKLRKLATQKHYEDFKTSKEMEREKEMKNNVIFNLGEESNILSCCYDYDDYYLAFGSDDSIIRVYKTTLNKLACCFTDSANYGVPLTCIKFKPITVDNILMSCRVNGAVSFWNIEKNQLISSFKEENYIYTCEYSRDGTKFATAGYDTKIRVYDQNTLQMVSTLQKDEKNNERLGHTNRIYGLKSWAEHPEIMLSGGWDETVFLWDTRVGHHVEYLYGPLICGDSLDIKGQSILTGSWRNHNQLQIWDIRNKKNAIDVLWENLDNSEEKNKRNHIYVSQFNKTSDRYIIAGTTGANEIRIFDKNENYQCMDVITGFQKPVYTLNFNNLDQKIAFGSGNGLCGIIEA